MDEHPSLPVRSGRQSPSSASDAGSLPKVTNGKKSKAEPIDLSEGEDDQEDDAEDDDDEPAECANLCSSSIWIASTF